MGQFMAELFKRNRILFWFAFFNLLMTIFCFGFAMFDHFLVAGINVWLKPFKYYFSVSILACTFGWILYFLHSKLTVKIISWVMVISLFFENAIILLQAYRKVPSHFNEDTQFDSLMYHSMIFFMVLFVFAVSVVTIQFYNQKKVSISQHYCWGIRLGMLSFLIFSLIGGWMLHLGSHSMPLGNDTSGIPFLGWSRKYGDFRVAHFLGVHALQIIPLVSYYALEKKNQVIVFSFIYFICVLALFILAFMGQPIFPL